MNTAIAVWRVLVCPLAVPEGMRGTDNGTTEGGRDKRRGTDTRYVVVLLQLFKHSGTFRSAAPAFNTLISHGYNRAAPSEASI